MASGPVIRKRRQARSNRIKEHMEGWFETRLADPNFDVLLELDRLEQAVCDGCNDEPPEGLTEAFEWSIQTLSPGLRQGLESYERIPKLDPKAMIRPEEGLNQC